MAVRPVNMMDSDARLWDMTQPVSESSPVGFSRMDLYSTDTIWIGRYYIKSPNLVLSMLLLK